jgi:two-component system OmpR family sensor kinase
VLCRAHVRLRSLHELLAAGVVAATMLSVVVAGLASPRLLSKTVGVMLLIEAVVGLPLVAAVVLGTFCFSRRALLPVHAMMRTARNIVLSDAPETALSHRVTAACSSTETRCIANTFNAMPDRVDREFAGRRKAEGELRDLVAAAGHELRTPLTTISGYAQLARCGALDDPLEFDRAMQRVQEEASRMTEMVDDLLSIARLGQARPMKSRAVDLAELCSEVVSDARVRYPEREIRYTEQGAAHTVPGDPHRLRQVLINLVGNCAMHTPVDAGVEIRLSREGPDEVVDVIDDGPGIPEELRGRVFEPFFQAHPRASEEERIGSGLGLSIVATIVGAHGGSVSLEPSERGAWFRVRIPAERPNPEPSPATSYHATGSRARRPGVRSVLTVPPASSAWPMKVSSTSKQARTIPGAERSDLRLRSHTGA